MPFDNSSLKPATLALMIGRDRIERHGWFQGEYTDPSGSGAVCVLGALGWNKGWDEHGEWNDGSIHQTEYAAATILAKHVAEVAGDVAYIPVWNDCGTTTKEDVLRAFDRAIAASICD
jgi:hypothetical protein